MCVLRQTGEPRLSQTYFTRGSVVPLKAKAGGVRSYVGVTKSKNLIEWKSRDPQTGVELYCFGHNVITEAR